MLLYAVIGARIFVFPAPIAKHGRICSDRCANAATGFAIPGGRMSNHYHVVVEAPEGACVNFMAFTRNISTVSMTASAGISAALQVDYGGE
jgi:hypothetical protein